MLQIISGRFFNSSSLHTHHGKGVLYSNYSWVSPIETCIGTLEPIDSFRTVSTYVFSYVNKIEQGQNRPGEIVRVGDPEIIRQFQLLCMFGLRAYFAEDRANVLTNCRSRPISARDNTIPSKIVTRFFDSKIQGSIEEVQHFARTVEKIISLPRRTYLSLINSLDNIDHALQILNWNLNLSYSLLVYCLESLSTMFHKTTPQWSDYGDTAQHLDKILTRLPPETANDIRAVLLKSQTSKAIASIIAFTESHLTDSFFTTDAANVKTPLRRSHLRQALRNAYKFRSGYVHRLQPIQDHLHHHNVADGDIFLWDKQPYLTFKGLLRVIFHALNTLIFRAESLEREDYNWRQDLPGILTLQLAPHFWIARHDNITSAMDKASLTLEIANRLSGFLFHLVAIHANHDPIVDMRPLLEIYEKMIPTATQRNKLRMLVTYTLYNSLVEENARRQNWQTFVFNKNKSVIEQCTVETMAAEILIHSQLVGEYKIYHDTYKSFCTERFSKQSIELPLILELKLQLELANMALRNGNEQDFFHFIDMAIGDSTGNNKAQKVLLAHRATITEVDHEQIFPLTTNTKLK